MRNREQRTKYSISLAKKLVTQSPEMDFYAVGWWGFFYFVLFFEKIMTQTLRLNSELPCAIMK